MTKEADFEAFEAVMKESGDFTSFVVGLYDAAERILSTEDKFDPVLVVVGENNEGWILEVPDGAQEMASFFVDAVEKFRGDAKWYAFLTETWALDISTDDAAEIQRYINNPSLIVDSPFKTERVSFKAQSREALVEGYIPFERDESGAKIVGSVVISEGTTEDYANVANLLEPMVQ